MPLLALRFAFVAWHQDTSSRPTPTPPTPTPTPTPTPPTPPTPTSTVVMSTPCSIRLPGLAHLMPTAMSHHHHHHREEMVMAMQPPASDSASTSTSALDTEQGSQSDSSHWSPSPSPSPVSPSLAQSRAKPLHVAPMEKHSIKKNEQTAADGSAQALLALQRIDKRTSSSTTKAMAMAMAKSTSTSTSTPSPSPSPSPSSATRRKRKSTHALRKQELESLSLEMRQLEATLASLQGTVYAPSTKMPRTTAAATAPAPAPVVVVDPRVTNALLWEEMQDKRRRIASVRSMASRFACSAMGAPLHSYLHLPRDRATRQAILRARKPLALRHAQAFLIERSRFLELSQPHASCESFVGDDGGQCGIQFHVNQYDARWTVRQVYEATRFYIANIEIGLGEGAGGSGGGGGGGMIVLREDEDDSGDEAISQHRLVKLTAQGLLMDVNAVAFTEYDADTDCGLLTAIHVDDDELHPYRPQERIRADVAISVLITRYEGQVVMRHWCYSHQHNSEQFTVTPAQRLAARERCGSLGNAMARFVQVRLSVAASAGLDTDSTSR